MTTDVPLSDERKCLLSLLYNFVISFICMSNPVYLEKDPSEIYEEFLAEDDNYQDEEERASDRMQEMVSKYGSY